MSAGCGLKAEGCRQGTPGGRSLSLQPTAVSLVLAATLLVAGANADDAAKPAVDFGKDLAAAQSIAKSEAKPLLVLVEPSWYPAPEVAKLDKDVLSGDDARKALEPFVRVRLGEGEEREVHARHRVKFAGYPLAVVLDADGTFLGSTSGLPAEEPAKAWPLRVASIPVRAKRLKELRAVLAEKPEDPPTLFALALLHVEADEPERAAALFERMEKADDLADGPAPLERLGEARFQLLRMETVKALADRRFADVDPACEKWLRRFGTQKRAADVKLLQANALYLAGEKDRAKEIWKALVEKDAGTDAARRAKEALEKL